MQGAVFYCLFTQVDSPNAITASTSTAVKVPDDFGVHPALKYFRCVAGSGSLITWSLSGAVISTPVNTVANELPSALSCIKGISPSIEAKSADGLNTT